MPGVPAVPKNSATSDQPNAASVPSDTRVSIVAAPCRRLVQAAWWNCQPPQTTTGAARVSESHCQKVNWSAGIMAMATTGTVSTTLTNSLCRKVRSSESRSSAGVSASVGRWSGRTAGRGTCAV